MCNMREYLPYYEDLTEVVKKWEDNSKYNPKKTDVGGGLTGLEQPSP